MSTSTNLTEGQNDLNEGQLHDSDEIDDPTAVREFLREIDKSLTPEEKAAWSENLRKVVHTSAMTLSAFDAVVLTPRDQEPVTVAVDRGAGYVTIQLVDRYTVRVQMEIKNVAVSRTLTAKDVGEQPPKGWTSKECDACKKVLAEGGYSPKAENAVKFWYQRWSMWLAELNKKQRQTPLSTVGTSATSTSTMVTQMIRESVKVQPLTVLHFNVDAVEKLRGQLQQAASGQQEVNRASLFDQTLTDVITEQFLLKGLILTKNKDWQEWPIKQLCDEIAGLMKATRADDTSGVHVATTAFKSLNSKGLTFGYNKEKNLQTIIAISTIIGDIGDDMRQPQVSTTQNCKQLRESLLQAIATTDMGKAVQKRFKEITNQWKANELVWGLDNVWRTIQKALLEVTEMKSKQDKYFPSSTSDNNPTSTTGSNTSKREREDGNLNNTRTVRGGHHGGRGQGRGQGVPTQYENPNFLYQTQTFQGGRGHQGGRGRGGGRANPGRGFPMPYQPIQYQQPPYPTPYQQQQSHQYQPFVGGRGGFGGRGFGGRGYGGRPINTTNKCDHCGKKSHPNGERCVFLGDEQGHGAHPDVNPVKGLPWCHSPQGMAWAEIGFKDLPCRRTLSGVHYDPGDKIPKRHTNNCKYNELNSIDERLGDIEWRARTMYIKPPSHLPHETPLRVEALLDSGSIGSEGNYISPEIGDKLRAWGYKSSSSSKIVCSCFEGQEECRPCISTFKLTLSFKNYLDVTEVVTVQVHEINTVHDLIIGYNDLVLQQQLRRELITQLETAGEAAQVKPSDTMGTPAINEAVIRYEGNDQPVVSSRMSRKKSKVMTTVHTRRLATLTSKKETNPLEDILKSLRERTHGSDELQQRLNRLYKEMQKENNTLFSTSLNREGAKVTPMELFLSDPEEWESAKNSLPPRVQSSLKNKEILAQVEKFLKAGVIRHSKATAYSQVMMTPKPDGSWRFCIDFRRLNLVTNPEKFPLPKIQDILERIGEKKAKYYAVLDLTKGYYQAPLSEASKILSAFITPHGLYEWNRVAMGLKGAPGYFQRALATEVLYGLLYAKCELYLDDIIVFGKTEDEFVANLEAVFKRLAEHNIVINPNKAKIGLNKIEYVGHTIDEHGKHFEREKLQKVIDIEKPNTCKQLKSFLGVVGHFRSHIRNHSAIVHPLHELSEKSNTSKPLEWNEETNQAFDKIKQAINDCPKLFFVDETSPIHLYTDASDFGIGGYLCQIIDGVEVPIAFYSKSLTKEERKWGTPVLEGYAIYRAFHHFHYLLRDAKTVVHTDHANLIYIRDGVESKVVRWKLELQEYDFILEYIKGHLNGIADFWSRNTRAEVDELKHAPARKAVNMLNRLWVTEHTPCGVEEPEIDEDTTMVGPTFLFQTVKPCCHKCTANQLNAADTWKRFQIPNEKYDLIREVHNQWAGHHGVDTTIEMLKKQGHTWQFMREHVRRFIHECDHCQKTTYSGHEVQIPRYIIGRYSTMERLGIDTIHTPGDEKGNNYIVAIIDHFTRFLQLYPVKDITKETIAECIMTHAGTFSLPCELCSDKGSEYVNDIIRALLEFTGTEHVMSMAYSKEENSIVERSNKETWRWLRAIVNDRRIGHNRVTKAVPFVIRIHNAKKVKSLGYSPGQMVFGKRIELDRNIFIPKEIREEKKINTTEWINEQQELQDTILTIAAEQQKKYDDRNKVKRTAKDNEGATREFPVGTYVLSAYPPTDYGQARPNKLHPMLQGPFEVLGRTNHTIQLRNLVSKKQVERNIKLLRPFIYDPARTDPRIVALNDYPDEFEVEQILSHSGYWNRKSQMKFVVRWVGYDHTWDSEEPFKNLKMNEVFREYVTEQGYAKVLPMATE